MYFLLKKLSHNLETHTATLQCEFDVRQDVPSAKIFSHIPDIHKAPLSLWILWWDSRYSFNLKLFTTGETDTPYRSTMILFPHILVFFSCVDSLVFCYSISYFKGSSAPKTLIGSDSIVISLMHNPSLETFSTHWAFIRLFSLVWTCWCRVKLDFLWKLSPQFKHM